MDELKIPSVIGLRTRRNTALKFPELSTETSYLQPKYQCLTWPLAQRGQFLAFVQIEYRYKYYSGG